MVQGLNIAKNALIVNQAAMSVVGNNIANMNTIGYSKQRVNLVALNSNAAVNNSIQQAGLGYGVDIESISRFRDAFVDSYYRDALSSKTYYETLSQNGLLLEGVANEFSGTGLSSYLNSFFAAANNLSLYPTDETMKVNFVQEAANLASELNNIYNQLQAARTNLVGSPANWATQNSCTAKVYCNEVNQLLDDIAKINENIIYQNNLTVDSSSGLLDERDILIDKLAEYIPVTVEDNPNGSVNILLGTHQLVGGSKVNATFKLNQGNEANPAIISLESDDKYTRVSDVKSLLGKSGKLGAILTLGGNSTSELSIYSMITDLNKIANTITSAVNNMQGVRKPVDTTSQYPAYYNPNTQKLEVSTYTDIEGIQYYDNLRIFTGNTAGNITINPEILKNPYKIATATVSVSGGKVVASDATEIGKNDVAQAYAELRNKKISGLGNLTFEQFNTNVTSSFGSKLSTANTNLKTEENVLNSANEKRESIIGVNIEEELMDLVKFQRAYEASARIFSVSDEVLQTLVNLAR